MPLETGQRVKSTTRFEKLFQEALGGYIYSVRRGSDLTLRQVGLKAGVSLSYVSDIEHGKSTPTIRSLADVAFGLGINPLDLVDTIVSIMRVGYDSDPTWDGGPIAATYPPELSGVREKPLP